MSDFSMLILLIIAKASLILGIVLGLGVLMGLRWPMGCTVWQRTGILSLIVMPICLLTGMVIELPLLTPPSKTTPVPSVQVSSSPTVDALLLSDWYDNTVESEWMIGVEEINAWREKNVVHEDAKKSVPLIVPTEPQPMAKTAPRFGYTGWLLSFYLIGMSLGLFRLLVACRSLAVLRKSACFVEDATWQSALQTWMKHLKIRQSVELLETDQASVPMTFGWRHPVILIPARCIVSCEERQRNAILVHELTHIARKDFLWQLLTQAMVGLYWFHPIAWFVRKQAEALRERLCDLVCSQQLGREDYARSLIEIAAGSLTRHRMSLGMAMAQQNSLRQRIDDLHSPKVKLSNSPSRLRMIIGSASALAVLGLIALGLVTTMKETTQSEKRSEFVSTPSPAESKAEAASSEDVSGVPLFNTSYDAGSLVQIPSGVVINVLNQNQIELVGSSEQPQDSNSNTVQVTFSDGKTTTAVLHTEPANHLHAWFGLPIDTAEKSQQFHHVDHQNGARAYKLRTESAFIWNKGSTAAGEEMKVVPAHEQVIEVGKLLLIDELESEARRFNQQVAAMVNGEPILNGEVVLPYSKVLKEMQKEIGQFAREALLDSKLTSNVLQFHVALKRQTDLLNSYYATRHNTLAKNVDSEVQKMALSQRAMSEMSPQRREDALSRIDEQFEKRLSDIKREFQVETNEQLEQALGNLGHKIADIRSIFVRDRLSVEYLVLKQSQSKPIEPSEIVDYYNSHDYEFSLADAAEWFDISFKYADPTEMTKARDSLQNVLKKLRRDIPLNVENMRPESMSPSSTWSNTDSLTPLDAISSQTKKDVIRTMPLNQWSQIHDDGSCLFIVQVTSRDDSARKPLNEVDEVIRQKLLANKTSAMNREIIRMALAEAKIESPYVK